MLESQPLTLASWNILQREDPPYGSDDVSPQHARCEDLAHTLLTECPHLDVLALYEVEGAKSDNCGFDIADKLALSNRTWESYGHPAEGLVMASRDETNNYLRQDLSPRQSQRIAVRTAIGGVSMWAAHLSWKITQNKWRTAQTQHIMNQAAASEWAIFMGDLNCLRFQTARQLIEKLGFQSVVSTLPKLEQATFPVPDYRKASMKRWQRAVIRRGLSIDDIYVKGLKIVDRGRFNGASDHYGLWATLER